MVTAAHIKSGGSPGLIQEASVMLKSSPRWGSMIENRRKKFYLDWGINPAYIGALTTVVLAALLWAKRGDKEQSSRKATLPPMPTMTKD